MSRPPRPYPAAPVGRTPVDGELAPRRSPSWSELLELQRDLAEQDIGLVARAAPGDFAESLFELSALVAHVLAIHHDHYADEAYLRTAGEVRSLIRHGKRLAYTPDPGLAATGVVALDVGKALTGRIPAGLKLLGGRPGGKLEQFETLAGREVAAAHNRVLPNDATTSRALAPTDAHVTLVGHNLGLELDELIVIAHPQDAAAGLARRVIGVTEDPSGETTTIELDQPIGRALASLDGWRLFAQPGQRLAWFGWNADPEVFPPSALMGADMFAGVGTSGEVYGWTIDGSDTYLDAYGDPIPLDDLLFLETALDRSLADEPIVVIRNGVATAYRVDPGSQTELGVSFHAAYDLSPPGGGDPVRTHQWLSATVTKLELVDASAATVARASVDPRSAVLSGWRRQIPLATTKPNDAPHIEGEVLVLEAELPELGAGNLAVLGRRDGSAAQLIEIVRVDAVVDGEGASRTGITWRRRTPAPVGGWTLADLVLLGNVVPVAHGRRVDEILGSSDGVTPFARHRLASPRVSQLPGPDGAIPALEVWVADVLWTRVDDFADAGPEDRCYVVELDDESHLTVVFGDGSRGAIPSAGRRHIRASYRVGLGEAGNLAPGQLARMAKAHPLIARVYNPLPLAGGTEPAGVEALRREANRWVRTIGRAVSVQDHADLALMFPGVARASASYEPGRGVRVTVAGADGAALADSEPLRQFLLRRRDNRVGLEIFAPEAVAVMLVVHVEIEPGFLQQLVEQAVRDALVDATTTDGLFGFARRELGGRVHLSEIYAATVALPGVLALEVLHFGMTEPTPAIVSDAIVVEPHQWLRLDPADLVFSIPSKENL